MARCCAIIDSADAGHDNPHHPESHARILNAIKGIPEGVPWITPEPATAGEIQQIHDPRYITWLREYCAALTTLTFIDADTYITPGSFEAALHAAGGAVTAINRSIDGEHAFALIRPPGHHAERSRAMGFCLFNNAAIAAENALSRVDRVAIVDWDVHHGNGTQHAFYRTDRVLYCSVHQAGHFPYSGSIEETGAGHGSGFTINAPLPAGAEGRDYAGIFSEVFSPAIERFRPGALIVSAGQDILWDDPLGGMQIQPEDFTPLTSLIARSAGCPLALVLEGGYGPSHGKAISHIFSGLNQEPADERACEPQKVTRKLISLLKKVHSLP